MANHSTESPAAVGIAIQGLSKVFGSMTVALVPIATAAIGVESQAQSLVYGIVIILTVALTLSRSKNAIVK